MAIYEESLGYISPDRARTRGISGYRARSGVKGTFSVALLLKLLYIGSIQGVWRNDVQKYRMLENTVCLGCPKVSVYELCKEVQITPAEFFKNKQIL